MTDLVDKKKRQTLKGMAAVAGATAVGAIPSFVTAGTLTESALAKSTKTVRQVWPPIAVKSPIELTTQVSASNNDIEVVLTNNSNEPVTMTQMSPANLNSPNGTVDLAKVLNKGLRQLGAGQSISVPVQQNAISITTDANQFSAVSYAVVA